MKKMKVVLGMFVIASFFAVLDSSNPNECNHENELSIEKSPYDRKCNNGVGHTSHSGRCRYDEVPTNG